MAKKAEFIFVCQSCGNEFGKWVGQCSYCGEWNSIKEIQSSKFKVQNKGRSLKDHIEEVKLVKVSEAGVQMVERFSTGFEELDRVFGEGGIVPGSVVLLFGEPGMGKSTLLSQLAVRLAEGQKSVLYVCGEESPDQVKPRLDRLTSGSASSFRPSGSSAREEEKSLKNKNQTPSKKISPPGPLSGRTQGRNDNSDIFLFSEIRVENIVDHLVKHQGEYQLVIIDSIQSVYSEAAPGFAGSVGQVRECGWQLTRILKEIGVAGILVGHVTKDGTIAGPKILEHIVDTVLRLDGDRMHDLRMVRAVKNRFGSTDELGVFRMTGGGLEEVKNPGEIFLMERQVGVPGSVITAVLEGTRVLLVEVQALIVRSNLAMPRRVANGYRLSRLQMILAVLQKHLNLKLGETDVFVNVAGGIRIDDPGADLAVALAVISSYRDRMIDKDIVCVGELGLLGEIRRAVGLDKRVKEAKKLGYKKVVGESEKNVRDLVGLLGN